MMGICKLCSAAADLRESHIVPRFAIQWLKNTGGGYFRQAVNPNRRKQDGPKEYWLCETCEQRFSSREGYFAETVFRPYLENGAIKFPYDERLFYCFVSLLWRSAISTLEHADYSAHWTYPLVSEVEKDWRAYLLGQIPVPKNQEVHVFLSDVTTGPTTPTRNFNSYVARAIDATVGYNSTKTKCFVYIKFSRFLLFGPLTPIVENEWINTKVHHGGGTLEVPATLGDAAIGSFLINRAEVSRREFESRVSEKTKEIISKHYERALPKLVGSDLLRVQTADFQQAVVPPGTTFSTKVGRNDPCPCGSGKKFKKCHGA